MGKYGTCKRRTAKNDFFVIYEAYIFYEYVYVRVVLCKENILNREINYLRMNNRFEEVRNCCATCKYLGRMTP